MAQKLPPPANTKAVFAGTAWFDTDKVLFAPAIVALANRHATFGCGYSSGRADCIINIGCDATLSFRDGPKDQTPNLETIMSRFRVRAHTRPGMTPCKQTN